MLLSSTRQPRGGSSSSGDVLGGLRRSVESLVASGSTQKQQLESTKAELVKVKEKLQSSRQALLEEKRQNAQMRGALDVQRAQQNELISLFERTTRHLSKCTDFMNRANRFDDQSEKRSLHKNTNYEIPSIYMVYYSFFLLPNPSEGQSLTEQPSLQLRAQVTALFVTARNCSQSARGATRHRRPARRRCCGP